MANLRNLNQQHPFWDWANSFEASSGAGPSRDSPWGPGPGAPRHEHHGPPPPGHPPGNDNNAPPPPPPPGHDHDPHGHHGRGGHGPRGGGRGRCGGRGGFSGFPPFGGRGMHGGPFGPGQPPFDLSALASWVQNTFGGPQANHEGERGNADAQDFTPPIDIFSTPEAYIIHASLPGAAKEDIAVNWDAASSTLILTGVVHRPGDEALLKAIEVSERKVGAFERKVVLGTSQEPAKVDEDGISAKLEDGVLRVEVPKLGAEEAFVEVKKVDIE